MGGNSLIYGHILTKNTVDSVCSVLQIRRGKRDNLEKISHISKKKTKKKHIFCDPSLEPSHRDGSN